MINLRVRGFIIFFERIIVKTFFPDMNTDSNPIDLPKLKRFIREGIEAIPPDEQNSQAILVIGDTGVGKSTFLSFLNGTELIVKFDGLKTILDTKGESVIKIGHSKYAETTIPTKVVIKKMAFYDSPGFKDNKGEQYEISNSFHIQRLLDLYQRVKIVLVVDQSHISEARADKLPKLIRNLHKSFQTFQDIKGGCVLLINRAGKENTEEDYQKELKKMIVMENENGYLFQAEERRFLEYILEKNRLLIFRQPGKESRGRIFTPGSCELRILPTIQSCDYVRSKHIHNILSESAKLAIRDFIDQITTQSNFKIELICAQIIDLYSQKVQALGRDVNGILSLKEQVLGLAQRIKVSEKEDIVHILQRELKPEQIQDFQGDFSAVMFFKGIYDKTSIYFSNLINKIYSELTHLLTKLDKRITFIQREAQKDKIREKEQLEKKIRQERRQKQKLVAMEHCAKMDDLKVLANGLCSSKRNMIQEIKSAMRCLASVEEQLKRVKQDALNLRNMNKSIESEFLRIEKNYFQKKVP